MMNIFKKAIGCFLYLGAALGWFFVAYKFFEGTLDMAFLVGAVACLCCGFGALTIAIEQVNGTPEKHLLEEAECEMRYAGWEEYDPDNVARADLYARIKKAVDT